jgi:hypothetical protein
MIILEIQRQRRENAIELCLKWIKRSQTDTHRNIFYYWLMVIAKQEGANEAAHTGFKNLMKIISSKSTPTRIDLIILERVFTHFLEYKETPEIQILARKILSNYLLNDDELGWGSFALKLYNLNILYQHEKQTLFKCWEETIYQQIFINGAPLFMHQSDPFSNRFSVHFLQKEVEKFLDFISFETTTAKKRIPLL